VTPPRRRRKASPSLPKDSTSGVSPTCNALIPPTSQARAAVQRVSELLCPSSAPSGEYGQLLGRYRGLLASAKARERWLSAVSTVPGPGEATAAALVRAVPGSGGLRGMPGFAVHAHLASLLPEEGGPPSEEKLTRQALTAADVYFIPRALVDAVSEPSVRDVLLGVHARIARDFQTRVPSWARQSGRAASRWWNALCRPPAARPDDRQARLVARGTDVAVAPVLTGLYGDGVAPEVRAGLLQVAGQFDWRGLAGPDDLPLPGEDLRRAVRARVDAVVPAGLSQRHRTALATQLTEVLGRPADLATGQYEAAAGGWSVTLVVQRHLDGVRAGPPPTTSGSTLAASRVSRQGTASGSAPHLSSIAGSVPLWARGNAPDGADILWLTASLGWPRPVDSVEHSRAAANTTTVRSSRPSRLLSIPVTLHFVAYPSGTSPASRLAAIQHVTSDVPPPDASTLPGRLVTALAPELAEATPLPSPERIPAQARAGLVLSPDILPMTFTGAVAVDGVPAGIVDVERAVLARIEELGGRSGRREILDPEALLKAVAGGTTRLAFPGHGQNMVVGTIEITIAGAVDVHSGPVTVGWQQSAEAGLAHEEGVNRTSRVDIGLLGRHYLPTLNTGGAAGVNGQHSRTVQHAMTEQTVSGQAFDGEVAVRVVTVPVRIDIQLARRTERSWPLPLGRTEPSGPPITVEATVLALATERELERLRARASSPGNAPVAATAPAALPAAGSTTARSEPTLAIGNAELAHLTVDSDAVVRIRREVLEALRDVGFLHRPGESGAVRPGDTTRASSAEDLVLTLFEEVTLAQSAGRDLHVRIPGPSGWVGDLTVGVRWSPAPGSGSATAGHGGATTAGAIDPRDSISRAVTSTRSTGRRRGVGTTTGFFTTTPLGGPLVARTELGFNAGFDAGATHTSRRGHTSYAERKVRGRSPVEGTLTLRVTLEARRPRRTRRGRSSAPFPTTIGDAVVWQAGHTGQTRSWTASFAVPASNAVPPTLLAADITTEVMSTGPITRQAARDSAGAPITPAVAIAPFAQGAGDPVAERLFTTDAAVILQGPHLLELEMAVVSAAGGEELARGVPVRSATAWAAQTRHQGFYRVSTVTADHPGAKDDRHLVGCTTLFNPRVVTDPVILESASLVGVSTETTTSLDRHVLGRTEVMNALRTSVPIPEPGPAGRPKRFPDGMAGSGMVFAVTADRTGTTANTSGAFLLSGMDKPPTGHVLVVCDAENHVAVQGTGRTYVGSLTVRNAYARWVPVWEAARAGLLPGVPPATLRTPPPALGTRPWPREDALWVREPQEFARSGPSLVSQARIELSWAANLDSVPDAVRGLHRLMAEPVTDEDSAAHALQELLSETGVMAAAMTPGGIREISVPLPARGSTRAGHVVDAVRNTVMRPRECRIALVLVPLGDPVGEHVERAVHIEVTGSDSRTARDTATSRRDGSGAVGHVYGTFAPGQDHGAIFSQLGRVGERMRRKEKGTTGSVTVAGEYVTAGHCLLQSRPVRYVLRLQDSDRSTFEVILHSPDGLKGARLIDAEGKERFLTPRHSFGSTLDRLPPLITARPLTYGDVAPQALVRRAATPAPPTSVVAAHPVAPAIGGNPPTGLPQLRAFRPVSVAVSSGYFDDLERRLLTITAPKGALHRPSIEVMVRGIIDTLPAYWPRIQAEGVSFSLPDGGTLTLTATPATQARLISAKPGQIRVTGTDTAEQTGSRQTSTSVNWSGTGVVLPGGASPGSTSSSPGAPPAFESTGVPLVGGRTTESAATAAGFGQRRTDGITPVWSQLAQVTYSGTRLTARVTGAGPDTVREVTVDAEVTGWVPMDHWLAQLRGPDGRLPPEVDKAHRDLAEAVRAEDAASTAAAEIATGSAASAATGPTTPTQAQVAALSTRVPEKLAQAIRAAEEATRRAGGFVVRPLGPDGRPVPLPARNPRVEPRTGPARGFTRGSGGGR
jgi:hypothetical protein